MATVKKGILTRAGEWWVHLRPYGKREFWKGERRAAERDAAARVTEAEPSAAEEYHSWLDEQWRRHRRMD